MADKKTYKDSLNLPRTDFAMEARLTTNEPKRLAKWREMDLYQQVLASRKAAQPWVLHDGPPFANGDIHIGHVLNKTLKDVFIRFKTMQGYRAPYVPGWDCHGLPIEHKIQQDLGKTFREMSPLDVRQKCAEYAQKYVDIQCEQFQRMGILGDWSNPYLTMRPTYEAATLEVFARAVENGLVYKQLKTGPWSIANQTALADAELEYQDKQDQSVYVAFASANPGAFKAKFDLRQNAKVSFMIWTTTPWTLPANLAIAVNPTVAYALVKYLLNQDWHVTVLAAALVEKVMARQPGATEVETVATVLGSDLLGLGYQHPFIDRTGTILPADYVTTTDGTGLVHTAPGHGEEDYETGMRAGLPVYCPVQANGRYDSTTPNWLTGLTVWEGNGKVIEKLAELGVLFAQETITHPYAHDWRSKTPIIYRATEQWFVGLDRAYDVAAGEGTSEKQNDADAVAGSAGAAGGASAGASAQSLRARALSTVGGNTDFVPGWGRARMAGMLQSRPDWCISRQRSWGLPIPVFYNEAGAALLTPGSVRAVAGVFAEQGSDAWYRLSPAQLLAGYDAGAEFPVESLRKEKDIFDVWFESGSSWHSVLQAREPELKCPADLYLEGSDQHRGWFQLSLLTSLAATGRPPFKQVLTHGFIVGPDGKKVSKSDKNYVKAVDEINRHGADLLRLFVSSADYEGDVAASPKMIQEFGDRYRKIRNTLRFLLSNLFDYDGSAPAVPASSLDAWALDRLASTVGEATAAYDAYQLHRAFRAVHDFCAIDVSSIYGNAMKDRLYCDRPDSDLRRRSQHVMHQMVLALTKLIAPVLVFTADEAWEQIPLKPEGDQGLASVHLARLPHVRTPVAAAQREEWARLFELREAALLQLDQMKKAAGLNKSTESRVVYTVPDEATARRLREWGVDLEDLVSAGSYEVRVEPGATPGVRVVDVRQTYPACARSWKRRPDVGSNPAYPDLSARDADAVANRPAAVETA